MHHTLACRLPFLNYDQNNVICTLFFYFATLFPIPFSHSPLVYKIMDNETRRRRCSMGEEVI